MITMEGGFPFNLLHDKTGGLINNNELIKSN